MNKLDTLVFISVLFSGLTILFWLFYPYNPLEIVQPMVIVNEGKTIKGGGLLLIRTDFCKNTNIKPIIRTWVVNRVEYKLSEEEISNTVGQNNKVIGLIFPRELPADIYHIKKEACYKINPLREICVSYKSEEFIVTK